MALCSYDEAYTIPTEKAAELSLRTMQILIHEMGICDTVDPLGGSYYVEALTDRFETEIKEEMKMVKEMGGIVDAVSSGKIQEKISHQAYEREKGIQDGEIPKVGVNMFQKDEEPKPVEFHLYNADATDFQIKKLQKIKERRNDERAQTCLEKLREDSLQNVNLMPSVIEAVKAYATVGEIIQVMKDVYGEYEEPIFF
jgi:methylmalonyl-CoA mutase N-terminal domain/subunit